MAHEIEKSDGLVLHREKAWHGLGTIVENAPTPVEALRIAGLDWRVEQWPIVAANPRGPSRSLEAAGLFSFRDSSSNPGGQTMSAPTTTTGERVAADHVVFVRVSNRIHERIKTVARRAGASVNALCRKLFEEGLPPEWQDQPTIHGGWYWCEELASDSPPQMLRRQPGTMRWERWTLAGWVELGGRVAPCRGRPLDV